MDLRLRFPVEYLRCAGLDPKRWQLCISVSIVCRQRAWKALAHRVAPQAKTRAGSAAAPAARCRSPWKPVVAGIPSCLDHLQIKRPASGTERQHLLFRPAVGGGESMNFAQQALAVSDDLGPQEGGDVQYTFLFMPADGATEANSRFGARIRLRH